VVAHADSLRGTARPGPSTKFVAALIAVVATAVLLRWVQQRFPAYRGVFGGEGLGTYEVIYRAFLAFYGLVFPAYAWLFMVPRRLRGGGRAPGVAPTGAQSVYFAAVIILAAPAFWLAFIEGRMVWIGPGLALVILARFLLPKPSLATAASAETAPTAVSVL
jgi:hypothetical protein